MTFTVFVSISLLALVVTARPFSFVDPERADGSNATRLTSDGTKSNGVAVRSLREAVQAVFQSRTGYPLPGLPSSLSDTDIRVHLTSPSVITSHLAALEGLDAVKAVLPLPFSTLNGEAGRSTGVDGAELSELTEEEKQLYELLRDSSAGNGSLEEVDGGIRPVPELTALTAESPASEGALNVDSGSQQLRVSDTPAVHSAMPNSTPMSPALLVLAVSALASLLIVACISLSIYSVSYFRKHVLRSEIAWDVIPRLEKGADLSTQVAGASNGEGDASEGGQEVLDGTRAVVDNDLIDFDGPVAPAAHPVLVDEKALPEYDEKAGLVDVEKSDACTSEDGGSDELNEKSAFCDVRDSPLLFASDTLPHALHIVVEEHPDPDLLPLPSDTSSPAAGSYATPLQRSPRVEPLAVPPSLKRLPSQTQMRERDIGSPVSKPAWSLRAAESPALGLPASFAHTPTTSPLPFSSPAQARTPSPTTRMPGTLFTEAEVEQEMREMQRPGRARAYRAPMPELDIAFALQLRPGLGLGAEGAWLVRFLMAMFGWLGVVVGGGGPARGEQRRTLVA